MYEDMLLVNLINKVPDKILENEKVNINYWLQT